MRSGDAGDRFGDGRAGVLRAVRQRYPAGDAAALRALLARAATPRRASAPPRGARAGGDGAPDLGTHGARHGRRVSRAARLMRVALAAARDAARVGRDARVRARAARTDAARRARLELVAGRRAARRAAARAARGARRPRASPVSRRGAAPPRRTSRWCTTPIHLRFPALVLARDGRILARSSRRRCTAAPRGVLVSDPRVADDCSRCSASRRSAFASSRSATTRDPVRRAVGRAQRPYVSTPEPPAAQRSRRRCTPRGPRCAERRARSRADRTGRPARARAVRAPAPARSRFSATSTRRRSRSAIAARSPTCSRRSPKASASRRSRQPSPARRSSRRRRRVPAIVAPFAQTFAPGDVRALASLLDGVARDPARRARTRRRGRRQPAGVYLGSVRGFDGRRLSRGGMSLTVLGRGARSRCARVRRAACLPGRRPRRRRRRTSARCAPIAIVVNGDALRARPRAAHRQAAACWCPSCGSTARWDHRVARRAPIVASAPSKRIVDHRRLAAARPSMPASYVMDAPAAEIDGATYVPLRFVADSLGAQVSYDAKAERVEVTSLGRRPHAGPRTAHAGRLDADRRHRQRGRPELRTRIAHDHPGPSARTIAITSDAKIIVQDVVTRTATPASLARRARRRRGRASCCARTAASIRSSLRYASRAGTIAAVSPSAFVLQSGYVVTPDKSTDDHAQRSARDARRPQGRRQRHGSPQSGHRREAPDHGLARDAADADAGRRRAHHGLQRRRAGRAARRRVLHRHDARHARRRARPSTSAPTCKACPCRRIGASPGRTRRSTRCPSGVNFGRTSIYGHLTVGATTAPRAEAPQLLVVYDDAAADRRHRAVVRPDRQQQQTVDLRDVPHADGRRHQRLVGAPGGQRPRRHAVRDPHRHLRDLQSQRSARRRSGQR